jgi:hypothetical protein
LQCENTANHFNLLGKRRLKRHAYLKAAKANAQTKSIALRLPMACLANFDTAAHEQRVHVLGD